MSKLSNANAAELNFDALMRANLDDVFNERDASRRAVALAELYGDNAVFYESESVATGRDEISAAVDALHRLLPPEFVFTPTGPGVGHHQMGRLRWQAGAPGGPAVVTGTDVAVFEHGKIVTLHVFLDPASR